MMFEELKFLVSRLFSAKYVLKGKCNACGKCCTELVFKIGNDAISTEEQFERVKKFDKRYNKFFPSGKFGENGEMLFTCKFLRENGKCGVHPFRSLVCRLYPKIDAGFFSNGGKLLEGCGYRVEINRKFSDFLEPGEEFSENSGYEKK